MTSLYDLHARPNLAKVRWSRPLDSGWVLSGLLRTEAKGSSLQHLIICACRHRFSYTIEDFSCWILTPILKSYHRSYLASTTPGQFGERGNVRSLYHRMVSQSQRAIKILVWMKGEAIWVWYKVRCLRWWIWWLKSSSRFLKRLTSIRKANLILTRLSLLMHR